MSSFVGWVVRIDNVLHRASVSVSTDGDCEPMSRTDKVRLWIWQHCSDPWDAWMYLEMWKMKRDMKRLESKLGFDQEVDDETD